MKSHRLEAFSDCVLSIIITVMVLDLHAPREATIEALWPVLPVLLGYLLSFIYLGIYWNNHHHMFQATEHINGAILWANLHLLFWLSLVPFVTNWNGLTHYATIPVALYGVVLLMAAIAFTILQKTILHVRGGNKVLAAALGRDIKGKVSLLIYAIAIAASFYRAWIANALYVLVALIWIIPDPRIEHQILEQEQA